MLIVSILQFMFSILSVDKLVSNTLMEVKLEATTMWWFVRGWFSFAEVQFSPRFNAVKLLSCAA